LSAAPEALAKDATVITVCSGVNSHRSTAAAARSRSASKAGFRVRHRLDDRDALYQAGHDLGRGGFSGWLHRGLGGRVLSGDR
jgi:rhodanese-related sulfurtransferase